MRATKGQRERERRVVPPSKSFVANRGDAAAQWLTTNRHCNALFTPPPPPPSFGDELTIYCIIKKNEGKGKKTLIWRGNKKKLNAMADCLTRASIIYTRAFNNRNYYI